MEGAPIGGPEDALPAGIGIVPDVPFQPDHWTADDLVRAQRRVEPAYDARLVGALLRRAGIDPSAQLGRLSAGQRTRLLLAAALGIQPSLVMLDEPFARLDPLARTDVLDELREHHAGGEDRTILLSTHDLGEIDRFVDHIVLLHAGRVWCSRAARSTCSRSTCWSPPRPPRRTPQCCGVHAAAATCSRPWSGPRTPWAWMG
ncbi:AAA family ATPase [Brachybacterium sp. Z12]|uniref:AAA family ATPase n=1 Tax=Brachybacterium sp. Z12 TaxID=2759167 RepID=UPI00223AA13B|nr:AAA family ATPase [Brachybacterium sp. Z12]